MSEQNNGEKIKRRFSQEQYDMLMRCSKKKDMTEWNEWLEQNMYVEILLEGARLIEAYLYRAHLECADLYGAHLERANLGEAHLEGAGLSDAHLVGASFFGAHLEGADLSDAHLEGAILIDAHLEGADLNDAHLEGASLYLAHLEGANLYGAHLEDADFLAVIVDGDTYIWDCTYDRKSSFYGVGLRSARVEPRLRAELEANNRQHKWEQWYRSHKRWWQMWILNPIVITFWRMSDYGRSAPRVIVTFFELAALFALIYCCSDVWVEGLWDSQILLEGSFLNLILRAGYFSVVTMTTLGFGDVVAQPMSIMGHILLTIQVLLGYIMLAALVSRLAVLFQEG